MSKKPVVLGVVMMLLLVGFAAGQEIHDVAVTDVTPSASIAYTGWTVEISVTLFNNGTSSENFTVTAYYDSAVIDSQEVTDLEPGNSTTLVFILDTASLDLYNAYTISANASIVADETDTANNTFIDGDVTIAMVGDANGDMKIDILDILEIFSAFGSTPEDSDWNPFADLNSDGKVNILDFILIALKFGQTWP